MIRDNNTQLQQIWLGSNHIGDKGAIKLATVLQSNTCLLELNIWGNQIESDGATALVQTLLLASTAVTGLHLRYNCISDAGGQAVLDALLQDEPVNNACCSLTNLCLYGNNISLTLKEEIQELIEENKQAAEALSLKYFV